jgi:hypothetical protein
MIFLFSAIVQANPVSTYIQDYIAVRGYGEFRFSHSDTNGTPWQTVERIRPTLKWYLGERVSFVVTPQATFTQGRYEKGEFYSLLETPIEESLPNTTLDDISEECNWNLETERQINEVQDFLTIPRLFIDLNTTYADFRLGKQSVNWGSALFFNPTDVLAENLIASPWQERTGVNALRTTIPISKDGQIVSIIATDDAMESWKLSIKGGSNIGTTDVYAVGFLDDSDTLVGVDIKGDAVVGFWAEGAYRYTRDDGISSGDLNISIGTDYSLPIWEQVIFIGQLTYDSSGEIDPKYYDWSSRQNPDLFLPNCDTYQNFIPEPPDDYRQTLGRWYGLLAIQTTVNDRTTLSTSTLFNLNDGTGLLFPSISTQMGDRWELNAGGQFFLGENGEFKPQLENNSGLDLSSLIPTKTVLAWARWSL